MTKKVKNNTQAGTKVTPAMKKEVEMPTLEQIEASELPASYVDSDSFEVAEPDQMEPLAPTKFVIMGREGELMRPDRITDMPLVIIAGDKIELKECKDLPIDKYCVPVGVQLGATRDSMKLYKDKDQALLSKMKWYTFTTAGLEVIISSGSTLVVRECLSVNDYWYEEDEPRGKSKLIMAGAMLETSNLVVRGTATVNNSSLIAQNHVELVSSNITTTMISSGSNITVRDSVLTDCGFLNHTQSYTSLIKCRMTGAKISGFKRVNLNRVEAYEHSRFNLNGWARGSDTGASLEIKDITLNTMNGHFGSINEALSNWTDVSNSWAEPTINISRRIDYGQFSSLEMIPFARVGKFDLLVGGEVFLATDFFPVDKGETYPVPSKQVQVPGLSGDYTANYGIGLLNTGAHYRGTMVWNRAAKIIFGYQYGKQPIGKTGEAMVNTLVEQIKSRIGIYVELSNLSM
ncbi:hypothetical protein N1M2_147 [Klebsiella phage N1M2]|uniref:Uncharacterized protein n=1 Tax=Klebsiella phage N1M2 TaxID=2664939 RepID=A0A6B7ZEU5_9CAUD|nr:hypothetical protein PQB72_gp147 [Klebsiella phage N1M2]QGH72010.1 hypothetical protein N1M2_147 [Klebsiella phage N1M2]